MAKEQYNFWEVKDSENFPLVVFSVHELSDYEVAERAQANNLISGAHTISVRAMTLNEIKMHHPNTYAYSLDPRAYSIRELLKMSK